ncbi:unnamed protein product [Peniophora sp. CBMAI 1063]|nr:unnamed protein product [Peniophora sp. CBMAI 1063]
MAPTFVQLALSAFLAASLVSAESHTISFTNNCGKGTPQLIIDGQVVSNGTAYTNDGVINGIAYLQTGPCLLNGENCALMEFNMANPVVAGGGSSVDISLISPHALNVPIGFNYYNGCDGTGSSCLTDTCHTAFFEPDDNQVQVACQTDNVDLMITFCPSGSSSSSDDSSSSTSVAASSAASTQKAATTSSAAAATSTAAAVTSTASSADDSAATSPVKHVAAATSVESTATASASASAASTAATTRASSKTCKAKAAARKRSDQSAAKRANSWHHRSRNARAAF